MDYVSIKNLEKYHPHYSDGRNIVWIRWNIDAVGDYKISKLTPTQRWLFIGLVGLACKHKNMIPFDEQWIAEEVKYPKKHILNDLKMLQTLDLLVTKCDKLSQNVTKCDLRTDVRTNDTNGRTGSNNSVEEFFNYFLLKTKKQFKLTPANKSLIKKRLDDGYTIDNLKKAVDNFVLDDWPDRSKHLDLIYCIGKQQGKPDALEKWLNCKPKINKAHLADNTLEKIKQWEKEK